MKVTIENGLVILEHNDCVLGTTTMALNILESYQLAIDLTNAIKELHSERIKKLEEQIKDKKEFKNTIFEEMVECEQFVSNLKVIKIPLSLGTRLC
jgi:tRNA isopentenyl-2-thiomethyl-A-37 hydroxylase MiaE